MDNVDSLKVLDGFFFIFHIGFILFNLFGWIFKRTRKLNLLTLLLTAFSWFVLGIFYGWGYCFLTDWHWQVRDALGYATPYNSYIQFLLVESLGIHISAKAADMLTLIAFLMALVCSIFMNYRDRQLRLTKK